MLSLYRDFDTLSLQLLMCTLGSLHNFRNTVFHKREKTMPALARIAAAKLVSKMKKNHKVILNQIHYAP